jgi:formate dehydrogenase iron-sulfur subunit
MEYGILIDTTLCVGCYECEKACAERWGFALDTEAHKLSSTSNTAIHTVNDVYVPHMCMHCDDPTCASVCPVGAFTKTREGAVVYDASKCMGCRYCMQACPFDVPRYQWDSLDPKITKCDMCHDRIVNGEKPACVEICPAEARMFGPLEDMIELAKKRMAENPNGYYNKIYGLKEAGGTSVIYLAAKPFEELALRTNLPDHPLPDLTWAVMSKIPNYVFWGATLLGGVWWITNRRKEVAAYELKLREMEEQNLSKRHALDDDGQE